MLKSWTKVLSTFIVVLLLLPYGNAIAQQTVTQAPCF